LRVLKLAFTQPLKRWSFCCTTPLHDGGMKYGYARVSMDSQSVGARCADIITHCQAFAREKPLPVAESSVYPA
jgi:hypothetical protein